MRKTAVAVADAPTPTVVKRPEKIQLNPNHLLETIQRMLTTRPPGWFNVVVRLQNNLVDYLRGNGPVPKWEDFPIARDWFTQNVIALKEIPQG